jgi:hypothetical protein
MPRSVLFRKERCEGHVVAGVSDVRLGIAGEPPLAFGGEDIAAVDVGVQEHRARSTGRRNASPYPSSSLDDSGAASWRRCPGPGRYFRVE